MKVLMVGSDNTALKSSSPLATRLASYAEHLDELHVLLLGKGKGTGDLTHSPKLHIHDRTTRTGIGSFLGGSKHARKIIEANFIDIVSAQNPFEHGWVAARAVRDTRTKLHLQVHTDYLSPWFTRGAIFRSPQVRMPLMNILRVKIADRTVLKAQGIRVVSQRVKDSMTARYGTTIPTPSVIPIPVSTVVPPPAIIPDAFPFTLIAVSRLEPEKRIQDCIAAVARLREGYPMLGLVIVGEGGERRRLERYALKRGVGSQVRFLGWRTDAQSLLQSAQAFIQASAYEGYGISLIESALAGVPIITSDVGIVGEVFVGYEHVFAAPVGDPTNLAALIARLIEDHMARRQLSIQAREAAQRHLASLHNTPADIVTDMARTLLPAA